MPLFRRSSILQQRIKKLNGLPYETAIARATSQI